MLIRKKDLTEEQMDELLSYCGEHLPLLFDIETTGLSWRTSHIYLLGLICRENGRWILTQWFLDRPSEEKQMLEEFSGYIGTLRDSGHDLLVQYNGDSFDLPYVAHKYESYGMKDPFGDWETLDIYRRIRPYQKLLGLPSLRQKNLESYLGIGRNDEYSGGDLIGVYQSYLGNRDSSLLDLLLLHNHDDVLCMPEIIRVLSFCEFFEGGFAVRMDPALLTEPAGEWPDTIEIPLLPARPLPASCRIIGSLCTLTVHPDGRDVILGIPVRKGIMKHFFHDYRNYYYLPREDQAIHKSVAAFVDSSFKQKAAADTCYQKKQGNFLPVPAKQAECLGLPLFQDGPKDKTAYVRAEDLGGSGADGITAYAKLLLASLSKPVK